jgi:hypothetical protein
MNKTDTDRLIKHLEMLVTALEIDCDSKEKYINSLKNYIDIQEELINSLIKKQKEIKL